LPIVGVGGIDSPESAGEKIDAGASLVQIYTSWIYNGPLFGRELARALQEKDKTWV
jgi:dihydroorotate dehydrogenase